MSRGSEMSRWTFVLCDGAGNELSDLTSATGKQLKFARNHYAEATLVLSHNDAVAELVAKAIAEGPLPTLRAYRTNRGAQAGTLRFNGHLAPSTANLDETQQLQTLM